VALTGLCGLIVFAMEGGRACASFVDAESVSPTERVRRAVELMTQAWYWHVNPVAA
jgi:hypothetical protein